MVVTAQRLMVAFELVLVDGVQYHLLMHKPSGTAKAWHRYI